MDYITGMVIVATIALFFYRMIELFARRQERMTLIEKFQSLEGVENLNLNKLFPERVRALSSLRISLLMLGLGAGFILALSLYNCVIDYGREYKELLLPACLLICGGAALLVSYFIEIKQEKK